MKKLTALAIAGTVVILTITLSILAAAAPFLLAIGAYYILFK